MNLLEYALQLAELGYHVFPVNKAKKPLVKSGFKVATTNKLQIQTWWKKHRTAGIGIATGYKSNLVVLDVDLDKKGAEASLAQIMKTHGGFENTPIVHTGGGGLHYYFQHPGKEIKVPNAQRLLGLIGIDVRGDGGYVVAPPSNHESGNRYQWDEDYNLDTVSPMITPNFMYDPTKRSSLKLSLSSKIRQGERNATLASIAGLLRSFGLEEEEIFTVLLSQNESRCKPPLDENEVKLVAKSSAKYPPYNTKRDNPESNIALEQLLQYPLNDYGFAQMINHAHLGKLRFNHDTKNWLVWHKHWWKVDKTQGIIQKAIHTTELLGQVVANIENEDRREQLLKYVGRIQNQAKIASAIHLAQSIPGIATRQTIWDTLPLQLAVMNGVLDLNTGKLNAGDPEDLLSSHIYTDYDIDATCPRWLNFLDEVFNGDQKVIQFVQRAIGYSLTGKNDEQCMFLLVGSGANGKSVFLSVIRKLLGDFGVSLPFSTFLRNTSNTASNDLALLSGKRLAIASETNENSTFDEGRIKSITGGDSISARYLYSEYFEFEVQAKIWLGVNHLPNVRDDSEGFWRRVRKIDFPKQFTPEERDTQLTEKLYKELPGILTWAVEGAKMWLKDGLHAPVSVIQSTQHYRESTDPLTEFIETACTLGGDHRVKISDLYRHYKTWGIARMLKPYELLSTSRFNNRISRKYPVVKSEGERYYTGINSKSIATMTRATSKANTEKELPKRRKRKKNPKITV